MYRNESVHCALLYHVRHSDFGVLFKHTGHQAITANVINTLHIKQNVEKIKTLYFVLHWIEVMTWKNNLMFNKIYAVAENNIVEPDGLIKSL